MSINQNNKKYIKAYIYIKYKIYFSFFVSTKIYYVNIEILSNAI